MMARSRLRTPAMEEKIGACEPAAISADLPEDAEQRPVTNCCA